MVREQEKKFALPGCFVQGFLIPDDKEIVENLRMGQDLKKRLIDLEKNKLKPSASMKLFEQYRNMPRRISRGGIGDGSEFPIHQYLSLLILIEPQMMLY